MGLGTCAGSTWRAPIAPARPLQRGRYALSEHLSASATSPLQVVAHARRPATGSGARAFPYQAIWRRQTTSCIIVASSDGSETWSADVPSTPPPPPSIDDLPSAPPPPRLTLSAPLTPLTIGAVTLDKERSQSAGHRSKEGEWGDPRWILGRRSGLHHTGDPNGLQERLLRRPGAPPTCSEVLEGALRDSAVGEGAEVPSSKVINFYILCFIF